MEVKSAGFLASNRPSPPEAVTMAARRDIGLESHRSITVDATILSRTELVVGMENGHLRRLRGLGRGKVPPAILLGDLDPERPDRREIQDPWGHPLSVFDESFARIDRCLAELSRLIYSANAEADGPPASGTPRS